MPSESKAQHYIPKFYLKGFTDKQGVLWVYQRFKSLRPSKPKSEAHRPDYYTHAEQGERNELAEDILKLTESQVAPVIRKLANPQYDLSPENAADLILFVAFMFARVPSWRDQLDRMAERVTKDRFLDFARNKERFHELASEFENEENKHPGVDWEKLRESVLNGEWNIEQSPAAFNLRGMLMSALELAKHLRHFGYEGLFAPEGSFFMTSDTPVFTILPDAGGPTKVGMGFGWPGIEVYFPLNKRTCLRLKKGLDPQRRCLDKRHVDQINRVIMLTASQYLYSCERYRRIERLFNERNLSGKAETF